MTAETLSKTVLFLKEHAKAGHNNVRLSVFYACLVALLTIAIAGILAQDINHFIIEKQLVQNYKLDFAVIACLFVIRSVCQFCADKAAYDGAVASKRDITNHVMRHIFYAQAPYPDGDGAVINTLMEGVEHLHGYYALTLPSRITAVFIPLAIFAFIVQAYPMAAVVLCATAPLIPIFMIWIGKGTEAKTQRQWSILSRLSGHFLDTIRGMKTLHFSSAVDREKRAVNRICEDFCIETMDILKIAFLSSLALEFFATVSIAMIAVLIGFKLLWHHMAFVDGFFILLLAPEFYSPLRKMGTHHHAKMEALGAAEKLVALIQNEPLLLENDNPSNKIIDAIDEIRCDNICLTRNGVPVLKDISFSLKTGDHVMLTGASGSGKSTLFRIMLGLISPDSGYILINNIPLQEIDKSSYWRLLGWVPQQPHLCSGTIKANIVSEFSKVDSSYYETIIKNCRIQEFERSHISENGFGLSGGQAQRVAVARALIRKPHFLLCDEPTAHMDRETETSIHHTLMTCAKSAIVLFSTHRLQAVHHPLRVLNLENGTLSEHDFCEAA